MTDRPIYRVTAERDGNFWFVKLPELPRVFTQVRRLDQAEEAIREVVSLVHGIDPASYDIELEVRQRTTARPR